MKILPLLVFAAAAGVGSGVMSFKYVSQLNYDNVVLTLRVNHLEREVSGLRKARREAAAKAGTRASVFEPGDRRARPSALRRSRR